MDLKGQTQWRPTREEGEWVIRGKRGLVSIYGTDELDVWLTHVPTSGRLERGGWEAKNHYDDGALFIRPWEDLDKACVAVRASKRRHLSPERRAEAIKRLSLYRKAHHA